MSTVHHLDRRRQDRRPVDLTVLILVTAGLGGWMLARAADPAMVPLVALWVLLAGLAVPLMTRFWQPGTANVRWIGASGLALSIASVAVVVLLGMASEPWEQFGPLAIVYLALLIAPRGATRGWRRDD